MLNRAFHAKNQYDMTIKQAVKENESKEFLEKFCVATLPEPNMKCEFTR